MKSIHPFPARMAPDTVSQYLSDLPKNSCVLDPMCGSGVVIRQSLLLGHNAHGFDIDPLAVLMSRVWTRRGSHGQLLEILEHVIELAMATRLRDVELPWMARCRETRDFLNYWFAPTQQRELKRLSHVLHHQLIDMPEWMRDCLQLAMSKIIVTKHAGASLAWDVSHSRPHRKKITNDFDVWVGYRRAVVRLIEQLDTETVPRTGRVQRGDCRQLSSVRSGSVDAVVTSPPYLNAIDYLRGHKLSLVWMGHSIPELREVRSTSVGTERSLLTGDSGLLKQHELEKRLPNIRRMSERHKRIVHKYASDAGLMLIEMQRTLKPGGRLVLVLGDSTIRGNFIANSKMFRILADRLGFELLGQSKRPLDQNKRYLPISSRNDTLEKRMRHEVIQVFARAP